MQIHVQNDAFDKKQLHSFFIVQLQNAFHDVY